VSRARAGILAALAALVVLFAAIPVMRLVHRMREENPIVRGARLSARLSCGACHTPPSGREIPNAGSRFGTVPAFGSGVLPRYAATPSEAAGIIRSGSPTKASGLTPVIFMPAYGGWLSAREIAELVAYVRAADGLDVPMDPAARKGFEASRAHGCFSCHGPAGAGGVPNPGSLTGEVPGFLGRDFADLVTSREELREWIRTGCATRVANSALAMHFLEAQRISMPAFPREILGDEELAAIEAYVQAIRAKR